MCATYVVTVWGEQTVPLPWSWIYRRTTVIQVLGINFLNRQFVTSMADLILMEWHFIVLLHLFWWRVVCGLWDGRFAAFLFVWLHNIYVHLVSRDTNVVHYWHRDGHLWGISSQHTIVVEEVLLFTDDMRNFESSRASREYLHDIRASCHIFC